MIYLKVFHLLTKWLIQLTIQLPFFQQSGMQQLLLFLPMTKLHQAKKLLMIQWICKVDLFGRIPSVQKMTH